MATLADLVGRVRVRLQDRDASNYAFPTDVLEDFIGEGLNRLYPVTGYRTRTLVNPSTGDEEFDLSTEVGSNFKELEDIVSDYDLPGWYTYGNTVIFEYAPDVDFTVWALCNYDDVTDLPGTLQDAMVCWGCSRALKWLLRRGGHGLRRYLAEQGDLEPGELERMADGYRDDYLQLREEAGVSSVRRF